MGGWRDAGVCKVMLLPRPVSCLSGSLGFSAAPVSRCLVKLQVKMGSCTPGEWFYGREMVVCAPLKRCPEDSHNLIDSIGAALTAVVPKTITTYTLNVRRVDWFVFY